MSLRKVKKIHPTVRDDIGDLVTHRALPSSVLSHIDPFLFLNHHGPQIYPSQNGGLPFGPHPHRGFETVTFILDGDLEHKDSSGGSSVIRPGGIQWMTAGRGLVHSEVSSIDFKRYGGKLEILQLWVNLPAKLKMTKPSYIGLQRKQLTHVETHQGVVNLVSGEFGGKKGPIKPLVDITLMTIELEVGGTFTISVPSEFNIFFYVVRGEVLVNERNVAAFHLVEFDHDEPEIEVKSNGPSFILFGFAQPFEEPIVAHGPFVMNTKAEIAEAIKDYQAGKFE